MRALGPEFIDITWFVQVVQLDTYLYNTILLGMLEVALQI